MTLRRVHIFHVAMYTFVAVIAIGWLRPFTFSQGKPMSPHPALSNPRAFSSAINDGMTLWDFYFAAALQSVPRDGQNGARPPLETARSAAALATAMVTVREEVGLPHRESGE